MPFQSINPWVNPAAGRGQQTLTSGVLRNPEDDKVRQLMMRAANWLYPEVKPPQADLLRYDRNALIRTQRGGVPGQVVVAAPANLPATAAATGMPATQGGNMTLNEARKYVPSAISPQNASRDDIIRYLQPEVPVAAPANLPATVAAPGIPPVQGAYRGPQQDVSTPSGLMQAINEAQTILAEPRTLHDYPQATSYSGPPGTVWGQEYVPLTDDQKQQRSMAAMTMQQLSEPDFVRSLMGYEAPISAENQAIAQAEKLRNMGLNAEADKVLRKVFKSEAPVDPNAPKVTALGRSQKSAVGVGKLIDNKIRKARRDGDQAMVDELIAVRDRQRSRVVESQKPLMNTLFDWRFLTDTGNWLQDNPPSSRQKEDPVNSIVTPESPSGTTALEEIIQRVMGRSALVR